jgi:hypothetical protein
VAPAWPDNGSRDIHGKAERSTSAGRRHRDRHHRRFACAQGGSRGGAGRLGRDRGRWGIHAGPGGIDRRADPGGAGAGVRLVPATGGTPDRAERADPDRADRAARPARAGRVPGRPPLVAAPAGGAPRRGPDRRAGAPLGDRRRPRGAPAADRSLALGTAPAAGDRDGRRRLAARPAGPGRPRSRARSGAAAAGAGRHPRERGGHARRGRPGDRAAPVARRPGEPAVRRPGRTTARGSPRPGAGASIAGDRAGVHRAGRRGDRRQPGTGRAAARRPWSARDAARGSRRPRTGSDRRPPRTAVGAGRRRGAGGRAAPDRVIPRPGAVRTAHPAVRDGRAPRGPPGGDRRSGRRGDGPTAERGLRRRRLRARARRAARDVSPPPIWASC